MTTQKYSVIQKRVEFLLQYIKDKDMVVPEIQRPFVWKSTKVRDLIDSLYRGFPVGYLITWKNPDVRLKSGEISAGKQILIDGQQRITALMAAVLGSEVVDENYKKKRISIAFHPLEEKFNTLTPAIEKSSEWISDISVYLSSDVSQMTFFRSYIEKNKHFSEEDKRLVEINLEKLMSVKNKEIGIIELISSLDISDVTEIFVRINSAGTVLDQSDFVMSKIASYEPDEEVLFGVNLRKCVDYFSHLANKPSFYEFLSENDKEFQETEYFDKIKWMAKENMEIYIPDYKDIIRVSFVKEFDRGKMSDLVKLLSGQNFEIRGFDEEIRKESFLSLKNGILDFINENHFKKLLIIINSLGIINSKLITSKTVLDMAYVLYLKLKKENIDNNLIEKYVKKWLVISMLTKRYSGSPETVMDKDIKNINKYGIEKVIKEIEEAELSAAFWKVGILSELRTASARSVFLNLFFMAQIYFHDKALLSKSVGVDKLIEIKGDVHHIFPKNYLNKNNITKKSEYNQIANFVFLQQEVNVSIGNKSPKEYFSQIVDACKSGIAKYGEINNIDDLRFNLKENAIPEEVVDMEYFKYEEFLEKRRVLMAEKIKKYYENL